MTIPISVVVPTYNRASLIAQTLDGILSQSLQPAEIIVVDDGSTDETNRTLAKYGERVRYIRQSNSGAPSARDRGVKEANSPWIAFCDSDDVWEQSHLERLGQLFERNAGLPFAFSNFRLITTGVWSDSTKFEQAPPGFWNLEQSSASEESFVVSDPLYSRILLFQPIFPSAIMLSREFYFRTGGYDAAMSYMPSEDLEFTLRCIRRGPVGVVPYPSVGIRKHEGNDSRCVARQLAGEVCILVHSSDHHDLEGRLAGEVRRSALARCGPAVDAAFASGLVGLTAAFARIVPLGALSMQQRIKIAISRLPSGPARFANRLLVGGAFVPSNPVVSEYLRQRLTDALANLAENLSTTISPNSGGHQS